MCFSYSIRIPFLIVWSCSGVGGASIFNKSFIYCYTTKQTINSTFRFNNSAPQFPLHTHTGNVFNYIAASTFYPQLTVSGCLLLDMISVKILVKMGERSKSYSIINHSPKSINILNLKVWLLDNFKAMISAFC